MSNLSWQQLAEGFQGQADFCKGYSPLYEALFAYVAEIAGKHASGANLDPEEQAFIDLIDRAWANRALHSTVESSLLFSAAIHAAVLSDAPEAAGISRFYSTVGGSYTPEFDREVFIQALGGLFLKPGDVLSTYLQHGRVQTNEVSRGAIWLLPAMVLTHWANGNLPITLVDLGCSAGLNLAADAQTWHWLSRDGERSVNDGDPLVTQSVVFNDVESAVHDALPVGKLPRPQVIKRLGLDLNPLDVNNPDDLLTLRACQWGDQADRLERFDKAVAAYQALKPAPEIHRTNIIDAARTLHEQIAPGTDLLLVYNSAVTIYLDDPAYAELRNNIAQAFRSLPQETHGLWLELEAPRTNDPATPPKVFPIKAHKLIDNELTTFYLAQAEPHPQTITFKNGWSRLAF